MHDLNHFWRVWCGLKAFDWGVGAQAVIWLQDGAKVRIFIFHVFVKNCIEVSMLFVSQF